MQKIIGNTCFALAAVFMLLLMFTDWEMDILAPLFGICMWAGIILRAGDFFKWRGQKHAEGFREAAQQKADRYCSKCGHGLLADTAFCPKCGNRVN